MERKIIFSLLLFSAMFSLAYGEIIREDGTFAAQFLGLSQNAVSLAMQQTDSDQIPPLSLASVNPARIIRLKGKSVQFTYSRMFDLIDFNVLSFGWRVNKKVAFGTNIFYLKTTCQLTDERGFGLNNFDYQDVAAEFIYAYRFLPTAAFGLSGKILQENIYQQTTNGLAASAGIYTQLPKDYGYLSFAIRNAGTLFNRQNSLPTDFYLNWTKSVSYLSISLAIVEKFSHIPYRFPDGIVALVIQPIEIIDGYFSCRYSPEISSIAEAWATGVKIKIHSFNIHYGFAPHQLGTKQILTLSWSW